LANPTAIKIVARHGEFTLGPGPVNFLPAGEDVKVIGSVGKGSPNACSGKFVPLPQ